MKILFFGDIFGRPGRTAVKKYVDYCRDELKVDLIIANADNVASGRGPTEKTYTEMVESGIDLLTCGDHIWDQTEIMSVLEDKNSKLIRPLNYPKQAPGKGFIVLNVKGVDVLVCVLLGRVFTQEGLDSPFAVYDQEIRARKEKIKIIDFHGEATSEKYAFARYVADDASAVLGTHTHVQTADDHIMNKSAYITDVGSCGPTESVIGVETEISLKRFLTGIPAKFEVADKTPQINAVIVDIDPGTGQALSIERINQILD